MPTNTERQYSTEDVSRIIRRALKIDQSETINHEDLLKTAGELGIDQARLEEAVRLETEAMEKDRFRRSYQTRLRSRYNASLWGFAVLNGFLFMIDLMTPGGWWFQWPMLGMGVPLLMHARRAYFPTDDEIHRAARRRERNIKRSIRRRHQKHHQKIHCC